MEERHSLDDDIARIAALRGKSGETYRTAAQEVQRLKHRVYEHEIRALFQPNPDARAEQRAFDLLPTASRQMIASLPYTLSAIRYTDLLLRMNDERGLIAAVKDVMTTLVRDKVRSTYGDRHPQAGNEHSQS